MAFQGYNILGSSCKKNGTETNNAERNGAGIIQYNDATWIPEYNIDLKLCLLTI